MILYYLYNLLSFILVPFIAIFLTIKEYKKIGYRIFERFGISIIKNRFSKNLIWIHASSIGELNIAILLIKEISKKYRDKNYQFLITTSNSSSSSQIIKNAKLKNVIHQYMFIDNIVSAKIFFSHWRPILGIFIESEIFPATINYIGKQINLILLNAKISDSSYKKWLKVKSLFKYTIENFKLIITQSKYDYQKYQDLGANKNLINIGNIKYARKFDHDNLIQISKPKNKIVVVCGSTYEGEEIGIFLSIIELIKSKKVILILVPRYIERIEKIKNQLLKYNLNIHLRSGMKSGIEPFVEADNGEIKIPNETDIYLVDSFGELNSFYNIADISIIGNSFKSGSAGHNIIEPANFKTLICFGSNMLEFRQISEEFVEAKAGVMLKSYSEINEVCNSVINNELLIEEFSNNAKKLVRKYQDILNSYIENIDGFIK